MYNAGRSDSIFHLKQNEQTKIWEIAFASEEHYKITGLTEQRVEHFLKNIDTMEDFPEDTQLFAKTIKQLVDAPERIIINSKMTGQDGKLRDVKGDMYSVLNKDGNMQIYGHIIDMTEQNRKQEQIHIREEEGKAILEQSGRMVYRYVIKGRRAILSKVVAAFFDLPLEIDNWPQWAIDRGRIKSECAEEWLGMFDAIDRGEKSGGADIKFCSETIGTRRYHIQFTSIVDNENNPTSAIISVADTTAEYERTRIQRLETEGLLQATREMFPEVIVMNLRKNEYRIVQYEGKTTRGTAQEGIIDDMINIRIPAVAEEDRKNFIDHFAPANIRKAFIEEGKDSVSTVYRRLNTNGEAFWFETTAMRMENPFDDDVMIVAVSRGLDEQKAEETRLRQQLRMQAEEIRFSMTQMGKPLSYYDVATSTLSIPATSARIKKLPEKMTNFPESLEEHYKDEGFRYDAVDIIKDFYNRIRKGEPKGSCEIAITDKNGNERWDRMEFVNIFDDNGVPCRAIVSTENITSSKVKDMENSRLREQEALLRSVARHSDRVVCYYDIINGRSEHWSEENCAGCILPKLCQQTLEDMLESPKILPESKETIANMFKDIHRGVVEDRCKIHINDDDDVPHWLDMKYSTRFDQEHKPVSVMFSYEDITERYEREMAYQHYSLMLKQDEKALLKLEADLTNDIIIRTGGTLRDTGFFPPEGINHEAFREMIRRTSATEESLETAIRVFSRENMLMRFTDGDNHLEAEWQMLNAEEEARWIRVSVDLVRDPYTDLVKGFCTVTDVTEEKEAQIKVQTRAERDSMTGLLNRGTCEERIAQLIEDGTDIRGGVMLLIDLDDLKGINDIYGHEKGDQAIRSIADTLKTHFREGDIIGRIGGDEFMVFLRKAAGREASITMSLSSLFRKLSLITVGENNDRSLRCSIGCSVEVTGRDSFESMYKRADIALYHVKRSGKNSFAFYTPEMEQADYSFRQNAISLKDTESFEWNELQYLVSAVSTYFPMIVSVNLTANSYYIMEIAKDKLDLLSQSAGRFDDFVKMTAEITHPEDRSIIVQELSRGALTRAYDSGRTNVVYKFRYNHPEYGYVWVRHVYVFYLNEQNELCCFGLTRNIEEQ